MDVTSLSGPVNLIIYQYNNKKYYFFGDIHFSRENSCQNQCDAFNRTFTKVLSKGTNCSTIGALFHMWFVYNNDHNIKTNVYIEETYTKEITRPSIEFFNTMIDNKYNVTGAPFQNKSWLQLIPMIMNQCFIREKENCPYYPNVHLHYVDIRHHLIKNETLSLFDLNELKNYLKIANNLTFDVIKNDILIIINYLIKHLHKIVSLLLDPYGLDEFMQFFDLKLSLNGQRILSNLINIDNFTTIKNNIRMTKVAWELYHTDEFINQQLYIYIERKINTILHGLNLYTANLKPQNIFEISNFKKSYEEFEKILNDYLSYFSFLHALLMDVYTISRMFIQDGEEIIIYAGIYHIMQYEIFFDQLNADKVFEIKVDREKIRCLNSELLPKYIDVNKYRQYTLNK